MVRNQWTGQAVKWKGTSNQPENFTFNFHSKETKWEFSRDVRAKVPIVSSSAIRISNVNFYSISSPPPVTVVSIAGACRRLNINSGGELRWIIMHMIVRASALTKESIPWLAGDMSSNSQAWPSSRMLAASIQIFVDPPLSLSLSLGKLPYCVTSIERLDDCTKSWHMHIRVRSHVSTWTPSRLLEKFFSWRCNHLRRESS